MTLRKTQRQSLATIMGIMTSLVLALEFIDFDTLDWSSVNTYVKLLAVCLPAVGGKLSEVSEKQNPPVKEG